MSYSARLGNWLHKVQFAPEQVNYIKGKSDILSTVMHIYHAQHWILKIFFSPTSLHFLILQTLNLPQCADLMVLDGIGQLLWGLQEDFVLTSHQQL